MPDNVCPRCGAPVETWSLKGCDVPNLIEGIQQQQNRVRELISTYEEIGPAGAIGAAILRAGVDEGDKAIASGDVVRMAFAYRSLDECKE